MSLTLDHMQVLAFWRNLDQAWPDKTESAQHTAAIVKVGAHVS